MEQTPVADPFPELRGPFTRDEFHLKLIADPDLKLMKEDDLDPGRTFYACLGRHSDAKVFMAIYVVETEESNLYIRSNYVPLA